MGKAVVLQHLGEAEYSVELKFNRDRAEQNISRMQERADNLETEVIPDLQNARDAAELDLNQASADLNAAIDTGTREEIETAQKVYIAARQAYLGAARELSAAEGEKAALQRRIQTIQNNLPEDKTVSAWCADYVTDLSGEVGTVEVPGERQHVQLRPGFEGRAAFDPSRDGRITPVMSTTPAGAFYNLALLPGWQRWMPQYRLGVIGNINTDTDTCDVTLDSETSSVRNLPVDQGLNLQGVPIEYMNCHSAAFSNGDRVLVEFLDRDFTDPVVIGFESAPLPCAGSDIYRCPAYLQLKLSSGSGPEEWYILVGDSLPYSESANDETLVSDYFDEDGTVPDSELLERVFSTGTGRVRPLMAVGYDYPITWTVNIQQYKPAIWDFCERHPGHPLCESGVPRETDVFQEVSYDDWLETMESVNSYVNNNAIYEGDTNEYWDVMSFPNASGDCEDYSLTKMQLLADEGMPTDAMDIVLCKLDGGGHAVLGVQTDRGVAYLEQAPDSPLLEYPELEDAKFVSRTLYPYEIEAVNRYAEVTGDKELTISGEGEFKLRTRDGVTCVGFYFRDFYMLAIRFHGYYEYELNISECEGDAVCTESTGTAYMHFYFALYRAVVRDGNLIWGDENWEWEQIAVEHICDHEVGLVGQDSGKFKVENDSFSVGPFSASVYPHTDETSTWSSQEVSDLEASLDLVDGHQPELLLPGRRDRETFVPVNDTAPYYYVAEEEEYVDRYVLQIDRPDDLDAAFKNFSSFYAV